MKTSLLGFLASCVLIVSAFGQTPTASPSDSAAPAPTLAPASIPLATVAPAAAVAPSAILASSATVSPTPDTGDDIDSTIEKQIRKHFRVSGDHTGAGSDSDVPWMAVPIVMIVFLTIFGTPVLIVAVIMYFSFSKTRALHRTVQMMVEKGQEVPVALLNPPPAQRQRSDLRRGVVLVMIGLGLMIFFAAANDWEGGAWSLGIIPFLIGAGYLLVWKLDARKENASPQV
ncbi:MAG: DUF6249 domain-containing protein [Verrucomicrobiota bacterium]